MAKKKIYSKLTTQQKLFVDNYIANKFNGKQAAISAGYSPNNAESQASRLLTLDKVQNYLSKRIKQVMGDTDTLAVQVINALKDIAFSDITDVFYWGEDGEVHSKSSRDLSESVKTSIAEISTRSNFTKDGDYIGTDMRLKQADKLKALDMLAKFVSLYEQGENINKDSEEAKSEALSKKERTERLLMYQEKLKSIKK
jgi:phage terminase small subunit